MTLPLTGYSAKRLADWRTDLRDDFRTALNIVTAGLGTSVNLDEGSVLGNLLDAFAARLDELSEASQDLFDSFDERNATGVYLENLARLVGMTGRLAATRSTATVTLTATAACTVPAGSIVADTTGQQWVTQTAHVFAGAGSADVVAKPDAYGPIPATAATITTIVTPVTNWSAVTNAADATTGRDRETDSELRLRRRQSLQITGASAPDAIQARVLAVSVVDSCTVYDNRTAYPVTLGTTTTLTLPGHSLAVVVSPNGIAAASDRLAIAQAIWDSAPAGIYTARMTAADAGAGGGVTETVTDSSGNSQSVNFSTAKDKSITFTVNVTKEAAGVTGTIQAAIKQAVVDYVASLGPSEQPLALPIYVAVDAVEYVLNVTSLTITGTVALFEQAVTALGDVTVNVT
jgi:uncharacterized phage protein gp47/JayE